MTLTLRSPAKINLHLRVGPLDAAGYHPLRSWMITTTLHDTITFEPADRRSIVCDDPTIPCDKMNLIWRAADALFAAAARTPEVAVRLVKQIPAGAGLGGGSSNAATTLVGLNRLFGLGRSREELFAIAATLGSDVPFFLGPPSAIATGRGEYLSATPEPRLARFALLIFPPFAISTPAAYRALDALRPFAPADVLEPFDAVSWAGRGPLELVESTLKNDLEPAAFSIEPQLRALQEGVAAGLSQPVRMSGSGSTLFTLFATEEKSALAGAWVRQNTGLRCESVELGNPSGFFD